MKLIKMDLKKKWGLTALAYRMNGNVVACFVNITFNCSNTFFSLPLMADDHDKKS